MCLLLLVAGKQPFWAAAADKKKYLSALRRMTADIEFEVRINRVSVCERQRELGAAACRNWERQLAAAGESRT